MENSVNMKQYTIDNVLELIRELTEIEKIVLLDNFRITDICNMLNKPNKLADWSDLQIKQLQCAGVISHAFEHIFDLIDKDCQDEKLRIKIKNNLGIVSAVRADKQEVE